MNYTKKRILLSGYHEGVLKDFEPGFLGVKCFFLSKGDPHTQSTNSYVTFFEVCSNILR